jgi:hypothetical protein
VRIAGEPIASRRLIPEFYEARGFRPAWGRPGQADAMVRVVAASRDHGLDPADYHAAALDRLLGASSAAAAPDAATLAARDLVLTDALVRLAYHLRFGKANPRELYPDWNFSRSLGAIQCRRSERRSRRALARRSSSSRRNSDLAEAARALARTAPSRRGGGRGCRQGRRWAGCGIRASRAARRLAAATF